MFRFVKPFIKKILIAWKWDLTKNLRYDRMTIVLIKKLLKKESNCVDVGAHRGEILQKIMKQAPDGMHHAFEPIPFLFEHLKSIVTPNVVCHSVALSNESGQADFHLVRAQLPHSG